MASYTSSRNKSYNKFGSCPTCNGPNTHKEWCHTCNSERFRKKFGHWTSGNKLIDNFIKESQLSATDRRKALEWIPHSQFQDFKFVAEGGFARVYSGIWKDGFITKWNHKENKWERMNRWKVALKILRDSNSLPSEFFDEIKACVQCGGGFGLIRCYGISQEPTTGDYIIVLYYANHGNLRTYLEQSYGKLEWTQKLGILTQIAEGLKKIHQAGFVHRDFHSGNILQSKNAEIADLGLTGPANKSTPENRVIYGVLPYVAPEVLRGKEYTCKSDIYSFGIIIWEVAGYLPPFGDRAHDAHLAMDICRGTRPLIESCMPKPLVELIKRCWDAKPDDRPHSHELYITLHKWHWNLKDGNENEITAAFKTAAQFSTPVSTSKPVTKTHPSAVYTSRVLNFPGLPKPVNAPNTEYIYRTRQIGIDEDEDLVYDSNKCSSQTEKITNNCSSHKTEKITNNCSSYKTEEITNNCSSYKTEEITGVIFVPEEGEEKKDDDEYVTRQFEAELSLEGLKIS